ncbi:LysR family transcriptional regulator [Bordetella genomosp. 8]|uniref:LysR family transcriptional regulator n=1 Tax=Bordetella genomosp. 8 TaxID=1416806 RepID=A0A1W6YJP3_9BORD|nr:LysR family transcriptional regulator [Bordetella genomosp. 8]ARP80763.1 LysR family transcriptional regulator [Bordetella genomosp. 8]
MEDTSEPVSLRQLRALIAVGDSGSFTGAAEQLGMSQPSVSHLVRRLEAELGQTLVVRGRDACLTPQGRAIVDVARRAVLSIDGVLRECRDMTQLKAGSVNVAVGHVTAATLLPEILRRFHKKHPELEVTVVDCVVDHIRAKLLAHEADIGLGALIAPDDSKLVVENLWDCGMALFVRDDHPLARRASVDARILAELPCIQLNPNAHAWLAISRKLIAHNIYPRVEQRAVLVSTALGLIQADMGVAMMPRIATMVMPRGIKGIPLSEPELEWPISLVRLANYPLSPAAQAFASVARDTIKACGKRAGA